jgi:hypothetical protein
MLEYFPCEFLLVGFVCYNILLEFGPGLQCNLEKVVRVDCKQIHFAACKDASDEFELNNFIYVLHLLI